MLATPAENTIEGLYQTHYGALLAHLTRLVGDRMTAEDLCQEIFLKAFKHWGKLEDVARLRRWL